jgi:hypothetical protein
MLMVFMLLLSSLHAVAGFITFASIPSVLGAPTIVGSHVIAVILVLLVAVVIAAACLTAACVTVKGAQA